MKDLQLEFPRMYNERKIRIAYRSTKFPADLPGNLEDSKKGANDRVKGNNTRADRG